jgi:hypothetical protein
MAQRRRHFFVEVDDDVRFAQIFRQPRMLTLQPQIFFRSQRFEDVVWPAPAASRPAATSTSLGVGGALRKRRMWKRRPRLPEGCQVYISR